MSQTAPPPWRALLQEEAEPSVTTFPCIARPGRAAGFPSSRGKGLLSKGPWAVKVEASLPPRDQFQSPLEADRPGANLPDEGMPQIHVIGSCPSSALVSLTAEEVPLPSLRLRLTEPLSSGVILLPPPSRYLVARYVFKLDPLRLPSSSGDKVPLLRCGQATALVPPSKVGLALSADPVPSGSMSTLLRTLLSFSLLVLSVGSPPFVGPALL